MLAAFTTKRYNTGAQTVPETKCTVFGLVNSAVKLSTIRLLLSAVLQRRCCWGYRDVILTTVWGCGRRRAVPVHEVIGGIES